MVDPYLLPSFSARSRALRFVWQVAYAVLFRPSPRPCHAWRAFLLQCFGAKLGRDCHVYPRAVIWAPWNLRCGDVVAIADGAVVYNPSTVELASHSIVSQDAYLCGAGHDLTVAGFPLVSAEIRVGERAWLCARSTVQMGVTVADGAVLALGAVATRDLAAWTIYGGIPARPIGARPKLE